MTQPPQRQPPTVHGYPRVAAQQRLAAGSCPAGRPGIAGKERSPTNPRRHPVVAVAAAVVVPVGPELLTRVRLLVLATPARGLVFTASLGGSRLLL